LSVPSKVQALKNLYLVQVLPVLCSKLVYTILWPVLLSSSIVAVSLPFVPSGPFCESTLHLRLRSSMDFPDQVDKLWMNLSKQQKNHQCID
ncbi:hypothetical protein RvY_16086, partial [Ramazzottius varieornatus]